MLEFQNLYADEWAVRDLTAVPGIPVLTVISEYHLTYVLMVFTVITATLDLVTPYSNDSEVVGLTLYVSALIHLTARLLVLVSVLSLEGEGERTSAGTAVIVIYFLLSYLRQGIRLNCWAHRRYIYDIDLGFTICVQCTARSGTQTACTEQIHLLAGHLRSDGSLRLLPQRLCRSPAGRRRCRAVRCGHQDAKFNRRRHVNQSPSAGKPHPISSDPTPCVSLLDRSGDPAGEGSSTYRSVLQAGAAMGRQFEGDHGSSGELDLSEVELYEKRGGAKAGFVTFEPGSEKTFQVLSSL
jgi:hypothetical protein